MSDKKIIGRPTKYTQKLANKICDIVATHPWGLKKICAEFPELPRHVTINEWRLHNSAFSTQYAKAKLIQADLLAEDCIDIADDVQHDTITKTNKDGEEYDVANNEWINRSRLRVDTRKWLAAKLLPKQYGDAKRVEELEGQNASLREESRQLREELAQKNLKEY